MTELYHYTSAKNFKKIISESKLLMNPTTHVKDITEARVSLEICKKMYSDEYKTTLPEDIATRVLAVRKQTYCCCFSKTPDNNYLLQHYADEKRGLILEFKCNILERTATPVTEDSQKPIDTENAGLVEISYEPFAYGKDDSDREKDFTTYLNSVFYKNDLFKSEEEIRVFYHPGADLKIISNPKANARKQTYKFGRNGPQIEDHLEYFGTFCDCRHIIYLYFEKPKETSDFYLSRIFRPNECSLSENEIKTILNTNSFDKVPIESLN